MLEARIRNALGEHVNYEPLLDAMTNAVSETIRDAYDIVDPTLPTVLGSVVLMDVDGEQRSYFLTELGWAEVKLGGLTWMDEDAMYDLLVEGANIDMVEDEEGR